MPIGSLKNGLALSVYLVLLFAWREAHPRVFRLPMGGFGWLQGSLKSFV
jgi:hypothetical protein